MSRGSIGLDDRLNEYVVKSHPPEHPVLAELRALTGRMANGQMQIAPEQGHFLAFLIHLIGATNTLEVGTFTGYSALAVALALPCAASADPLPQWLAARARPLASQLLVPPALVQTAPRRPPPPPPAAAASGCCATSAWPSRRAA